VLCFWQLREGHIKLAKELIAAGVAISLLDKFWSNFFIDSRAKQAYRSSRYA